MNRNDRRFHVIVLSNFARGFDKYAFAYGKAGIPESTYPDRFHLLTRAELGIGIGKARRLLDRLAVPGDRLLVLETAVDPDTLVPNGDRPRHGAARGAHAAVSRPRTRPDR